MHPAAAEFVAEHAPRVPVSVLDIGGRDVNGTTREAFHEASTWLCVDAIADESVDIVADAAELDLGRTFDVVVCTEVLEHCERWRELIHRASLHLADGGALIVTCAGPGRDAHSGVDASGIIHPDEWYANVSAEDLRRCLSLNGLRIEVCRGVGSDTQAVAWKI